MNTFGILLSMMGMVLITAFFLTFRGLNGSNTSEEEREELRREITALKQETETLRIQKALRRQPIINAPPVATYSPPAPPIDPVSTTPTKEVSDDTMDEIEELRKQLAEQQEENDSLSKEKEKAQRKQKVAETEAGMAWSERTKSRQKQERERKRVEIALKMGSISSVNVEYGFIIFQPVSGRQFQPGQTLGIRRNSGILGQITVKSQEGGSYIADLKRNAYAGGYPAAQEGDEIIVLPASYRAPGEEDAASGGSGSSTGGPVELLPQ